MRKANQNKAYWNIKKEIETRDLSTEEIEEFERSIRLRKKQDFGIIKLSKMNLNCIIPSQNLSLIRYASLLCFDEIVLALFNGGANPCFTISNKNDNEELGRLVRKKLMTYPSSYICYVIKMCVKFSTDEGDTLLKLSCGHLVNENQFWDNLLLMRIDEELSCPLNSCNEVLTLFSSCSASVLDIPLISKEDSLFLFNALPLENEEKIKLRSKTFTSQPLFLAYNYFSPNQSRVKRIEDLDKAISSNNAYRLKLLIEKGVNLELQDEYCHTPLYKACWLNHIDVIMVLLNSGADIYTKDGCFFNLFNLALFNNNDSLVEILKEKGVNLEKKEMIWSDGIINSHFITKKPILNCLNDTMSIGIDSFYIDNLFDESFLISLDKLFEILPFATKVKEKNCNQRKYFADSCSIVQQAFSLAYERLKGFYKEEIERFDVFPFMRFLHYEQAGSSLPPHTDLSRTSKDGKVTKKTFILYLTDVVEGGETNLLSSCNKEKKTIVSSIKPVRGRLFIFPHQHPHEGCEVKSVPKTLLRGEMF